MKRNLLLVFTLMFTTNMVKDTKLSSNSFVQQIERNAVQEDIITMQDIASFLETKKEHYPLSDEFIERYQQSGGGYLDYARQLGLLVNKEQHEPNQKWHFFDSWLYRSIDDGSLTWSDNAQIRVYKNLLCPELLLWIYEACEVSPSKVKEAKVVAESGKASKTNVTTIAKNMRNIVSWDDVKKAIVEFKNSNIKSYKVSYNNSEDFTITNLKDEYKVDSEVSFNVKVNNNLKVIDKVTYNDELITPNNGSNYKFTMPEKDVVINVTLKDKEIITASSVKYDIVYDLGSRKTAKSITSNEELLNTFNTSDNSIINSIGDFEYIYGGGNGGRGATNWYCGNMLKFGTTSVNGGLVFNLSQNVNKVKITGYVGTSSLKIRVGDSSSKDWNGNGDNKTTLFTCSTMVEASKVDIENKNTSTIEIEFESTNSLKIMTENKKVLYITNIEFFLEK